MKKILVLALFALFVQISPANAMGVIFEDYNIPIIATDMKPSNVQNLKCGSGKIVTALGMIETGNASIQDIVKKTGIKQIYSVDMNSKNVVIVRTRTITVCGE